MNTLNDLDLSAKRSEMRNAYNQLDILLRDGERYELLAAACKLHHATDEFIKRLLKL